MPSHILMHSCTVDLVWIPQLKAQKSLPCNAQNCISSMIHFWQYLYATAVILNVYFGAYANKKYKYLHFVGSCQHCWQTHINESTLLHKVYMNWKQTMIKDLAYQSTKKSVLTDEARVYFSKSFFSRYRKIRYFLKRKTCLVSM